MMALDDLITSGGRNLSETKRYEWIFIAIHSMGVPIILLFTWLHEPASTLGMIVIAACLVTGNLIAGVMNRRITSMEGQQGLSLASLIGISLIAWASIFHFVYDFDTAAHAGFSIVIIEGAVRFGLRGSIGMGIVFALGLAGAMFFRLWVYDLRFSASGYAFWTTIMMVIALTIGFITEETFRERQRNVALVQARALDTERNRIARELHDTVLKTLQGIALESHAIGKHLDSPVVKKRIEQIEEECQRSSEGIREVIHELRSISGYESIGDQVALLLRKWSSTTGIEAEFELGGDDRRVPGTLSYNVRCILSEALLNIQKHAAATQVRVQTHVASDRMQIRISDNGLGISIPEKEGTQSLGSGSAFGILGMRERIEQLGGRLLIERENGTRLTMEIPLM
ncbi:MAG: histidine kinase [Dehalococcoidia bacterium]